MGALPNLVPGHGPSVALFAFATRYTLMTNAMLSPASRHKALPALWLPHHNRRSYVANAHESFLQEGCAPQGTCRMCYLDTTQPPRLLRVCASMHRVRRPCHQRHRLLTSPATSLDVSTPRAARVRDHSRTRAKPARQRTGAATTMLARASSWHVVVTCPRQPQQWVATYVACVVRVVALEQQVRFLHVV